jgi:hypothetical protein
MHQITEFDQQFANTLDAMPRHISAVPRPEGKVVLDNQWHIALGEEDDIARCGAESLSQFLNRYWGLDIPVATGIHGRDGEIRLSWRHGSGEGFRITIAPNAVEIVADSPAGALYGAHRLQWMMGENGGPFLTPGSVRVEPAMPERISSTPFHQGFDDGGDPLTYSEGYLDLMAHYGLNQLHMYIDLYDYMACVPEAPELEDPEARARIARLATLARRAAKYNIGISLHINTTRRDINHPVFAAHPELRGAVSWSPGAVTLCSSEPLTTRILGDTLNGIIRQVPEVRSIIAIIGGECLLHCYTRPFPRPASGTNCPRCADRPASQVVAEYVEGIADRVWSEHADVAFIVWPYSAHLWSESPDQREFMRLLNPRIGFLTPMEKDAWVEHEGVKTSIFDYSISCLGPSDNFQNQRAIARERGIPFYVKTESSVTLDLLTMPYIPVPTRWQARWQNIVASQLQGVLAHWRFTGWTGTLTEEIAFREMWRSDGDADPLAVIAQRLAGDEGADACLAAWNMLSQAFARFPFCPGISGFPYFRGPLHLGPAHPLLLMSEESAHLPQQFSQVDPCWVEVYKGDEFMEMPRLPLYFDDYRWTSPLGIERIHRALETVCQEWDEGLRQYALALARAPEAAQPALQDEYDIADMTGVILHSALNLARFQLERDRVQQQPTTKEEAEASYRRMVRIVADDLQNSRHGLELARKHPRFGYAFTYGRSFDAEMIEQKIHFTETVLLPDIFRFYEVLISHAFACPFIDDEVTPEMLGQGLCPIMDSEKV